MSSQPLFAVFEGSEGVVAKAYLHLQHQTSPAHKASNTRHVGKAATISMTDYPIQ